MAQQAQRMGTRLLHQLAGIGHGGKEEAPRPSQSSPTKGLASLFQKKSDTSASANNSFSTEAPNETQPMSFGEAYSRLQQPVAAEASQDLSDVGQRVGWSGNAQARGPAPSAYAQGEAPNAGVALGDAPNQSADAFGQPPSLPSQLGGPAHLPPVPHAGQPGADAYMTGAYAQGASTAAPGGMPSSPYAQGASTAVPSGMAYGHRPTPSTNAGAPADAQASSYPHTPYTPSAAEPMAYVRDAAAEPSPYVRGVAPDAAAHGRGEDSWPPPAAGTPAAVPSPVQQRLQSTPKTPSRRLDTAEITHLSRVYYIELLNFFRTDRSPTSLLTPSRSNAREKLTRLSRQQFAELSTDVHDELKRRQNESESVPFLPGRDDFHPRRNQARQKLATLPKNRFRDLASDVFFELERRFPELPAELRPEPIEDIFAARSSVASARTEAAAPPVPGAAAAPVDSRQPLASPATGTAISTDASDKAAEAQRQQSAEAQRQLAAAMAEAQQLSSPQVFVPARSTAVEESTGAPYADREAGDRDAAVPREAPADVDPTLSAAATSLQARSADEMQQMRAMYEERIAALQGRVEELEQQETLHARAREEASVHQNHALQLQQRLGDAERLVTEREALVRELEQRVQELEATSRRDRDADTHELEAHSLHARELESAHARQREAHARELETARATHAHELETARTTHARELELALAAHTRELERLRGEHARELSAAVAQTESLRSAHDEHLHELESTHAELRQHKADLDALRLQFNELHAAQSARSAGAQNEADWKREIDAMQRDTEEQQMVVQELRGEVASLLDELRRLSARNDAMTADKESDVAIIRDLHTQMSSYKRRFESAKAELRMAQSTAPRWSQPRLDEWRYVADRGAVADTNLASFQSSIDELLAAARSPQSSNVLVAMKTVVLATTLITDDIAKYESAPDNELHTLTSVQRDDLATLQASIPDALSNLMNVSRNHAASQGMAPVSLVDAAATHVAMAIVEAIKIVRLRRVPRPAEDDASLDASLDAPSGLKPLHMTPRSASGSGVFGGQRLRSVSTSSPSLRSLSYSHAGAPLDGLRSSPMRARRHEPPLPPAAAADEPREASAAAPPVAAPPAPSDTAASQPSRESGADAARAPPAEGTPLMPQVEAAESEAAAAAASARQSTAAAAPAPEPSVAALAAPVDPTTAAVPDSAMGGLGAPIVPPAQPPIETRATAVGPSAEEKENWAELRNYIEVQTEAIVHSIQSLLSALREGVQGVQLNENLTQITTIVSSIVAISRDNLPHMSGPRSRPIAAEAESIFAELTEYCDRLSDMQTDATFDRTTKSVMASASYGVAKGLKALNELLNAADEAAQYTA